MRSGIRPCTHCLIAFLCGYLAVDSAAAENLVQGVRRFTPIPQPVALATPGALVNHDGKLDDWAWKQTARQPITLSYPDGASVETGAYWQMAADDRAIYVAVSVPEANPQFAKPDGKDQWAGDLIEFFVDIGDPEHRYQFCASPIGLRYDEKGGKQEWNGTWVGKGNVTPQGWTIELMIPLADLKAKLLPQGQKWQRWRGNLCLITGGRFIAWAGSWGDPAQFAPFFFGTQEEYRASVAHRLDISCPLAYCNQHDAAAPIRVVSYCDDATLDAMQLRVVLRPEGGQERSQVVPVTRGQGAGVAFDLSLTGIPRGTHQAQVDLVAAGKAVASGTVTFTRKDDGPALQASGVKGPVTLRQTRPSAASISSWYYVTGIPIPRGRLTDPASARLTDARGKEIPAHFEPLCHWSPKKEDIKWLRVAFCAPVVAGESPEYSLEFGPGVRSTPHPAPVRVTETPEQVTVDTGACRFVVPRSTGGFLRAVTQGEKELYRAPATDGPYVVDHTGAVFRAALDRAPELVVEEANPVRTVIRTEAWHVKEGSGHSPAGDRLNKSILRYYFYAGQPSVELHWTFVVTADTDKVQFRDIGFQLTGSGATRVGLDAGQERALTDGYLLQKKADLYVVRRKDGAAYVESDRGQRAPGWIANDRFALAMRHFSGMFPKELEARGSVAILHAWPGHGEYNEDWFIEPKAPPDPNIPHEEIKGQNGIAVYPRYIQNGEPWHHGPLLDFRYPDWWRNPNMAGTREKASWLDPYTAVGNRAWESWVLYAKEIALGPVKFHAAGTSRTQELLLDFGQQAAARALFLQSPHVWLKDTQWLDDARVLGPVNIHVAKSWLEGTKQGWERVEKSQHLGLWLYGNMPEYWYRDGTAGIYRMTAGIGHYGAIADWWLYMCSSDPVHLDYACAQARQYRDVHVVHYTSPDFLSLPVESRKVIGATTLMSPYPWFQGSDGWSMVRQFVYDYYLTGDRRSLEVLRYHALPTVRLARGALDRGCGAQLRTILDWYAHTWDPEAGEKIEEIIAWITSSDPKAESARKAPTPLNWTNCMPEYLELARDPSLPLRHREAMLTFVKGWVEEPAKGDTISCTGHVPDPGNLLACAWFHTGDPKYAMPFVRHIRKQKLPQEKWLEPAPGGGSSSAGNFDSLMYSYAAWRDAVEKGIVARLLEQGE